MGSSSDDGMESLTVSDDYDEEDGIGANDDLIKDEEEDGIGADDDLIKDDEEDQFIDERLNNEVKEADVPDTRPVFEDDEKNSTDSGVDDNDESQTNQIASESPPIDLQPPPTLGRGRYGRKAVDENNQELPAFRIYNVEPEDGFYTRGARFARLPAKYHAKRQSSAERRTLRALRRSVALMDFRAKFDHISFIVDQSDFDAKGYQHACRHLQGTLLDMSLDLPKPAYDVWNFGLHIYQVKLPKSMTCNLLDLIPEEMNNNENRPFWFLFKRSPIFEDKIISAKNADILDPRKGRLVWIDCGIFADLAYGALTSMNHFFSEKDHTIYKRSRWSLRFHDEFFEVQFNEFKTSAPDLPSIKHQKKYKITLDIIDRAAIIHLWNDGFSLFLNMKGNIHELHRLGVFTPKGAEEVRDVIHDPFVRQGMRDNRPIPSFSTIRLRFRVKDDESIKAYLERPKIPGKNTSSDDKKGFSEIREEAMIQIREVFKNLLDFLYKNRIHVCFGPILSRNAPIQQLDSLPSHRFSTFTQSYSWTMLSNINYRIQVQLCLSKTFINQLHDYSNLRYPDEKAADIDARFYRLCLYLHRRSSEYFFLDLDEEIKIGIEQYDAKYKRSKEKNFVIPSLNQLTTSTAYVPSVVLTPTTVKIRPLKLCKLNRILREERFGNVLNFALVELRDEAQRLLFPTVFRALKKQILHYLTKGFSLTPDCVYKYLHHSQSQVKCKQFWFYYHDKKNGYLSHEDAYTWMGNFDKERVVAKHAARIALCFTSSDATIQITADKVTYVRDIKDVTNKYAFSDGVGTISTHLRNEIKDFLKRRYEFSVLQIRYGGCKGTLSVDPNLNDEQCQLVIRDSMNKFTTDHDILELCKLSAPRALFLNRQDIVLLESRDIPHTNFLHLQNQDHLRLVRSLFTASAAYDLLQEKLLPVFQLREIAQKINIVEEQFFIKLIITCAFNIIRELLNRTRISISDKKARNMFGIVDEYGVLEYEQVFIQYTIPREDKLYSTKEERMKNDGNQCEIYQGEVVVTKNPCHHPGDLRRFQAVDHLKLRHLKDVIVFPQKGPRPHPNEISGSDLDGDEYVVIWHEDLIPKTPNEKAYDYDSQEDPPKMTRPITRDDINQVVMEVSEQDCLGSLSNIHLAYADKDGIKSKTCTDLAGAISQEVDAAKTGKHPLTEDQIKKLRLGLNDTWPDFMKARGKKQFYPSPRVLGKLYRSGCRALKGWNRAITNHGNPHHIQLAHALASGTDIKDDGAMMKTNTLEHYKQPLDPYIRHDNWKKYLEEIKRLYSFYQNELLEIISLYRFQDEIDLLCRCESMDSSAGGNKKGGLEDSATIEVQNLIQTIRQDFFREFDQRRLQTKCCKLVKQPNSNREKRIYCATCSENKLAKAACAYIYSYEQSNRLPLKSNRRILSFPWLFSKDLILLRERNKPKDYVDQSKTIVGRACSLYLEDLMPKFKVFIPENIGNIETVEFSYKEIEEQSTSLLPMNIKKIPDIKFLRACFVEILHDWLVKQEIFGDECNEIDPKPLIPESIWHELLVHFLSSKYQPNVRLLFFPENQNFIVERYQQAINNYRSRWTTDEYRQLQDMFRQIHILAKNHAKRTELTIWTYLDEYIILALQCIGIEKRLVDQWI